MTTPLLPLIVDRIRQRGPITAAEYVELALYHPERGYYASAAQRSGRHGDFITSVDVGPLFGEMLAVQLGEIWRFLDRGPFDLVEAAAGNGRLSRDILEAAARQDPEWLAAIRLHLVERSAAARAGQAHVLGVHAARLAASGPDLPHAVRGAILANELLDALPPHVVVMREDGLREVFVGERGGQLLPVEGPPSTPRLEQYLAAVGARLRPGWFAEVNLAAADWVRAAAAALERGFLLLIDYGHEASRLYSASHAAGTLTSFRAHASEPRDAGPGWLLEPGERDLTSHVDLTGVRLAAEAEGLVTVGIVDQTYFLLGLRLEDHLGGDGDAPDAVTRRLAAKTLTLPGGMGSTHKVLIFAKGVGRPALRGVSEGRLT